MKPRVGAHDFDGTSIRAEGGGPMVALAISLGACDAHHDVDGDTMRGGDHTSTASAFGQSGSHLLVGSSRAQPRFKRGILCLLNERHVKQSRTAADPVLDVG